MSHRGGTKDAFDVFETDRGSVVTNETKPHLIMHLALIIPVALTAFMEGERIALAA